MREGWERRGDFREFIACELEMARCLLEAAGLLSGVWILNKLSGIQLDLAASLPIQLPVPKDHLKSKLAFIAALEAGNFKRAGEIISRHLDAHDKKLLALLG